MNLQSILRSQSVQRRGVAVGCVAAAIIAGAAFWRPARVDASLTAVVRRGALTAQLTTTGTLRPIESLTYRSPVVGRELEIVALAPEGSRVSAGDLLVRLDTTELGRDGERIEQELRQIAIDLQVADGERQEAEASVKAAVEGEGALTVEESRLRLQVAQKKVDRLRQEYQQLRPLLERGFITRDELGKTAADLEQAEDELALARKRTEVVVQLTHPREKQRASLQLAQKISQLENARARERDALQRRQQVRNLIESCSLFARRPGLVVYEEFLNVSPRRKIRVGDRVTPSQGLVTIPEVSRMVVETTVGEAEVHRVHAGQPAVVRLEAFPDLRLTGTVSRVGTLASASAGRPLDDKRFDLVIEVGATTAELRPEMTARADITVASRPSVLLVPINAVFDEGGRSVAHVVGRVRTETRPIELGESNEQMVEVLAGLAENERVMLVNPSAAAATNGADRRDAHVLHPR